MEPGFNVTKLSKSEDLAEFRKPYLAAFSGESVSVEKNYFGREYIVTYNPLRDASGVITGVSLFTQDITERVEAQRQEKKGRNDLELAIEVFKKQEKEYQQRIAQLEKKLSAMPELAI